MNHESLVLTVIGRDRPGLVEALASLVADHHGNWLESRMAHLAGQFAGILHVEVPAEHRAGLGQALRELDGIDLKVTVTDEGAAESLPSPQRVTLDLVGHDRPGIVRQLSRVIASKGVNVHEIETSVESAPMSGEALFRARAILEVPVELEVAELQADLERVGHDLMVDLSFGA
jgi:glycine cleavage system regulatory protein